MTSGASVNPELIIKQLREEQETSQQFIYEYKKKITCLEILEKEYQEEIERLNLDKISIQNKLETKIEQFFQEKCLLKNSHQEELQILQKDLAELRSENERFKMEFDLNKKTESLAVSEDISITDVEVFKDKIMELENIIENLNIQLNQSQKQSCDLEEMNKILKNDNESIQENFNLKREELLQANELIQDLQDNIMCLRAEVDSMKNKPLDEQSRGNSLFAEVNDSRVQLVKKMKTLMRKYGEMAKEREYLLKENESLKNNKATMLKLIETDIKEYQPGNLNEISAYVSTISGLRKLIENYKEEISNLKKSDNSESSKDLKYYEYSLKCREKEIESLRQTLDEQSTGHIFRAISLSEVGREMANWKWKASQLEDQVQILTRKVKELEEGYNKELHASIRIDEKDEENEMIKTNISIANNKRHALKEKPIIENIPCERKLPSEKIVKLDEKKVQLEEKTESNKIESVIDLTDDSDEAGLEKRVHFSDNTKQESEHVTLRRGPTVVKIHVPATSFRETNIK